MTPSTVVIDASAFVKLMRPEPESEAFAAWLPRRGAMHAPGILPYELANVAMRHGLAAAYAALAPTLARVELHPGPGDIWPWAGELTAYDAAYLALAQRLGAELVTYDAQLAAAAKDVVPVVAPGR